MSEVAAENKKQSRAQLCRGKHRATPQKNKDFLKIAFEQLNLNYKNYIIIDKKFWRKNDKFLLRANAYKAKKILKWQPMFSIDDGLNQAIRSIKNH